MPDSEADAPRADRRRPPPVTILAAIQLLLGAFYGALGGLILVGAAVGPGVAIEGRIIGGLLVGLAALTILAAIGLLALRQIGWTLTMLLAGASLAGQVYTFATAGQVEGFPLLLCILTVLYLNQGPVQAAFRLGGSDGAELDERRA